MFARFAQEGIRAANSPTLRGSLPPGYYFSRSPDTHVKSPHQWGKPSNNYLANFHKQGGMQPKNDNSHTHDFILRPTSMLNHASQF